MKTQKVNFKYKSWDILYFVVIFVFNDVPFNALTPGKCGSNFNSVISEYMILINLMEMYLNMLSG